MSKTADDIKAHLIGKRITEIEFGDRVDDEGHDNYAWHGATLILDDGTTLEASIREHSHDNRSGELTHDAVLEVCLPEDDE